MTSYKKAFRFIDELDYLMAVERIPLFESCGRVLAEDITSDIDMPLFNKSAMDGIALRHADLAETKDFALAAEISAGDFPDIMLKKGECVRIMTGAPVPEGADTVIRREYLENYESARVTVAKEEPEGANIALFGEDFRKGDILLGKGTVINEFAAGTAATAGRTYVDVYMLPTVVYFSTGDEVEEPDVPLKPGMIRNSNGYSVISGLRARGIHAVYGGIVRDSDSSLEKIFMEYSDKFDIIILSGGVSEGNRDLVPAAATKAGFETVWHKLDIKPGKPQLLARRGGKFLFGLPGNPVSTALSLYLFVYPLIDRITGHENIRNCTLVGRVEGRIKRLKDRTHFMPAKVAIKPGEVVFTTVPTNGSGDIRGAAGADGYVIIPPLPEEFDEKNAEGFRLS